MDNQPSRHSLLTAARQSLSFLAAAVCFIIYVIALMFIGGALGIGSLLKSKWAGIGAAILIAIPVLWLFRDAFKPEMTVFSNDGPLGGLSKECYQIVVRESVVYSWMPLLFIALWFVAFSNIPEHEQEHQTCRKVEWKALIIVCIAWAIFGPLIYFLVKHQL